MKKEDYEWLVKILASVVNAGERGRDMTFSLTHVGVGKGYEDWLLNVYAYKKGSTTEIEKHLQWMMNDKYFDSPEDIVKVVNAL